jgi:predicted murein hydrolase (TIGR00659 family)
MADAAPGPPVSPNFTHLWVYLQSTPLFGLVATLLVFLGTGALSRRFGNPVWANPILLSIFLLTCLLLVTGTSYATYFQGAQYIHFLLGPATVALAVPMYANLGEIRRSSRAILPALVAGSLVASVSAMLIARLLGAPRVVVLSLAPKSVTTPVAMGIAEQIGGQPSMAAVFVLLTGLTGILVLGPVMRMLKIIDWRAQGLAGGTAAHGIATARLLLVSETAGAFGGLAIGLNALVTAAAVPLLARWLAGP